MIAAEPNTEAARLARRHSSKVKTFAIAFVLLAALIALLAVGAIPRLMRHDALAADVKAIETGVPEVNAVTLKAAAPMSEIALPASMQAIQEAPIYARMDGYLKSRGVDIGDRLKAGALMAVIEAPEVDQQLAQAKAALAHAVAALAQAKANLRESQSRLGIAKATADRWKTLAGRGVVSKQETEEKQSVSDSAAASVDAITSSVTAAEADVTAQEASVARLAQMKDFERVTAPFDGIVTARNVDAGALIAAGSGSGNRELFRMAKTEELRLFVNVPQSYSVAIHPGETAIVRVGEFPGRNFPGKIVRTADALDPGSRTLLTEVHIPNGGHVLRPGMFASVRFSIDRKVTPVLAPAGVFVFRSDGPHLAMIGPESRVHYATVTIGRDYGANLEILAGAEAGERAILNPTDDLAEGAKVQVMK
jgi:RND family efflux transporter MFP subunit